MFLFTFSELSSQSALALLRRHAPQVLFRF